MSNLKPVEIVHALDQYVVGQKRAKRMVAIALRNRWRRQQVAEDMRDEIAPKSPDACLGWLMRRFLKSRHPNSPRWAMWAAMSNPWCATCWN